MVDGSFRLGPLCSSVGFALPRRTLPPCKLIPALMLLPAACRVANTSEVEETGETMFVIA